MPGTTVRKYLLLFFLAIPFVLQAQWVITGTVTDAETAEPVPFATVVAGNAEKATTTDLEGHYKLALDRPYPKIRVEAIGYSPTEIKLGKEYKQVRNATMKPAIYDMQEVTVKPKRYSNKDNPAVELIRLVVDHRDKNRVPNLPTYQDEQYEKVVIGFGNIPQKFTKSRLFKQVRFIWENVDIDKIDSIDIVPIYIQENIQDFYSKYPPLEQEKITRATKSVRFKGFTDDTGIDKTIQYLYQPIDIYEPNILLLTNKFPSPISNTAPLLYRYYPVDTLEENGQKIVKLEFYPRNKYDMYLQGTLYIALDSTYPVTGIEFTINPHANLNWVKNLIVEQKYERHSSGKYMLAQEDIRMYFGIVDKVMGVYSERLVDHRNIRINEPLPADPGMIEKLRTDSVRTSSTLAEDSLYWTAHRMPLSEPEARTYTNMDSLINTRWFLLMTKTMRALVGGYIDIAPGVEAGPLPSLIAFNDIENIRLRLTARTRPSFSTRWQLGGQAAYGFRDQRWKFGGNVTMALGNSSYNRFPINRLTASYLENLTLPGQNQYLNNTIGTSIVSGPNDKLLYSRFIRVAYEKEYKNQFSFQVGMEQEALEPAGALNFISAGDANTTLSQIEALRGVLLIRYAPGENIIQSQSGARSRISYNFITQLRYAHAFGGVPGGDYTYDELGLTFQKFTNLPPFGYNTTILEAGGIIGQTAYPFLNIHRGNQSYFYQTNAYNLMNFMEFVSDRYVALSVNHFFNGFFLNKVPLIKRFHLREIAAVKILYGSVSSKNKNNPNLLRFPVQEDGTPVTYTLDKGPYIEASVGITNIFKVLRIDLVRRFNYLDHPLASKYAIKGSISVEF